MHIGLRLLFGFLAVTGLAAFFVLRVFVTEIKPSVGQVMEDLMVDSANVLADVVAPELARLPAGALLADTALGAALQRHAQREVDVRIWGLHKTRLDLRVLVTDAGGRVVFDSGSPSVVGQDYSRWRDVMLTLRGEYGARTSRSAAADDAAAVLHVAAPIRHEGWVLGALVVSKPLSSIAPFVERAERKVLWAGVGLLGGSLAIGVVVTLWTVGSVRQLRRYALAAGEAARDDGEPPREPPRPPALPGELGELAVAMDQMRQRLQGRQALEQQVRALTHELKGPLAAIRGAAELLQDELDEADRRRFVLQVDAQAQRLQNTVDQMLELSKLEALQALPQTQAVDLVAITEQALAQHAARLQQRELAVHWLQRGSRPVPGDAARLLLAVSNLLANALTHAPPGSALEVGVGEAPDGGLQWTLRDHGPGVPAYAMPRLGQRFYTTAAGTARGSGLGLAIVRQVLWLHRGQLRFEAAEPGLRVVFTLPGG